DRGSGVVGRLGGRAGAARVGGPSRLAARRPAAWEPARAWRPPRCGDRLRGGGRGRSGLRPDSGVVGAERRGTAALPPRGRPRRRDVGAWAGLGPVAGPDRLAVLPRDESRPSATC